MRYFNTYGPVNENEHYVVPRSELVADLVAQIERGSYFTIYAPRQMGKTTLLRRLEQILSMHERIKPLTFSFESSQEASVSDFLDAFYEDLVERVVEQLQSHPQVSQIQAIKNRKPSDDFYAYRTLFRTLNKLTPIPQIVLIIDEFDGTPQGAISRLLLPFREIYLTLPAPRSLQSVILIGLQNIAALNLGRSSPFNIAREHQLSPFTLAQIEQLYAQYTAESKQTFAPGVTEEIYRLTAGHPFLVNRLGAILSEELVTQQSQPISKSDLEVASYQLVRERNYNFESLVRRANPHHEFILNILFGAQEEFNLNDPVINMLEMHGIISRRADGSCQISNSIYGAVLLAAFQPRQSGLAGAILANGYDFRQHLRGNELQMDDLLSRFRAFVEQRGLEAFKVTPMPQEATGQYLLMAYLHLVVRDLGGDLLTEVDSGEGRMDLIVLFGGKRIIIETKIWRGKSKFDRGISQLEQYLENERQEKGYLVVFHARPKVYGKLTHKQLEFVLERQQAKIHVYLVRLGPLFEQSKKS